MRKRAYLLFLLGFTALVPERVASAADTTVAVLGVEASEGAPDTLAASITDAMRQRVAATKGYRLVPGRDLVEVKLVFSCPDEAPSCMGQAGKSLGANKLVFGGVKKSAGDSYVVTLKLLDTTKGVVDAWVAEQITSAQASASGVRAPVQKWFASLTGQGGVGIVRVRSSVMGASVALDGSPVGVSTTDELVISGVAVGRHEVSASKPGFEPTRQTVNVVSGEAAQVDLALKQSAAAMAETPAPAGVAPAEVPADRDDGGPSKTGIRTATWAVVGAGVLGVALGINFGIQVKNINNDLDPYRRFPCAASPKFGCGNDGKPATKALSSPEQQYVKDKQKDGDRLQTYQYVSYGIGGALLATGGYLFYRAYLQKDTGETASKDGPRLTVAPIIGPYQTGLVGVWRF